MFFRLLPERKKFVGDAFEKGSTRATSNASNKWAYNTRPYFN